MAAQRSDLLDSSPDLRAIVERQRDQLEQQERQITEIRELLGSASDRRIGRSRRRWLAPLVLAALATASVIGVAGASPTVSTTDVAFVPIPAHTLLSASIGAGKTNSPVVLGGATTVPTNATTVQIAVTAKSTKPGTLKIYPAGNPTGGSPQSVLFAANALAAATVAQNVGLKSAVTFENTGLAAVTVTAKLIGYSTQVTAGDIAPTGGVAGQVLTNTGPEAVWQTPNFQSTDTSTITVHPGSNGTANGTKLLAAVAAITPGAPTLVRLEAGTYDLGGATLALPSNSWVEGAGQGLTTVAGSAPNLVSTTTGNSGLELLTLSGAGSACVNIPSTGSVTVQLVSITGCARGISITGAATLSVVDSTINATNGRAIDASAGNIAVSGSTLADTGGIGSGIAIGGASVLKVSASSISGAVIGLLQSSPAISTVTGSQLIGNSASLNNGGQASVADSLLVGGVSNIGTLRCVGAYNASYITLSSTCT